MKARWALAVCLSLWGLWGCTDEPVGGGSTTSAATAGQGGASQGAAGPGPASTASTTGVGAGGAGGSEPSYTPCRDAVPCRVMPIGASITDGYNVPGGYRIHLWALVSSAGKSIDFVGSLQNGPVELPDKEHEGHSGWTIEEIDAIAAERMTTYTPDILLVHIGTNDIRNGDDPNVVANRLRALVDTMTGTAPDAAIVLASLVPLADAQDQLAADALNALVPAIVQDNQTANKHVFFADMANAVAVTDLADGVHPTLAGYDKMGTTWFAVIALMLP